MSQLSISINDGRYFWVLSEWSKSDWKYLTFSPDGQFDMKYLTEEDARTRCERMNENGQAEQRLADARKSVPMIVFTQPDESESIVWSCARCFPHKFILPSNE
jgi:hypothetical protein